LRKAFLTNILLLIFINALIKPLYLLGIDRNIQLITGTSQYGMFINILNFTIILQFISDFGLQNYTARFASQQKNIINSGIKNLFGFKILLSIIYFFVIIICSRIWYGDQINFWFVIHVAINQLLISAMLFIRSNIAGLGLYKTDSLLSALDRVILIIVCGLFIVTPILRAYITIELFVWFQSISIGLCIIIGLIILASKQYQFDLQFLSIKDIKQITYICLPFALIYLTSSIFYKGDTLLLERILPDGKNEVGIYAASMRLYEAASMFSLAFGTLLLAMFARLHSDVNKLKLLFKTSMNLLLFITICISFTGYFYSKQIISFFYHTNNEYWSLILTFMMLAFIPGSLNYILSAYFQATHKEKLLLYIYIFIAIISILLNIIFIPSFKALGSSWTYLLSQAILMFVQLWFIHKTFKFNVKLYTKPIAFFGISLVGFYLIHEYISINYMIQIALSNVFILVIAFYSKIFSIQEIKQIWLEKHNT